MDYLTRVIIGRKKKGKIKGVNMGTNFNLSHVLFADDILSFIEDKDEYIFSLKYILHLFE